MSPCPTCAETMKILRTGQNHAFVIVEDHGAELGLDWFDGRAWEKTECAGCGRVFAERSEPLSQPDPKIRAVR